MKDKISEKDKKAWEEFVNSKKKIFNKDQQDKPKNFFYGQETIDLHGYTLEEANRNIERFILNCYEKRVAKINIITGKGKRSKNLDDPYQSKDLSILKYSVPNFIKENQNLMKHILEVDFDAVNNPAEGNFHVILKKKRG